MFDMLAFLRRSSVQIASIAALMALFGLSGCSSSEEKKAAETEIDREELAKKYRQQSEGLLKVKQPKPTSEPR